MEFVENFEEIFRKRNRKFLLGCQDISNRIRIFKKNVNLNIGKV